MKKNTMKTALLIALLSVASYNAKAQNKELKVGNNPTIKQPSAVLEVDSANKGMLLPRVALTSLEDTTTIANPANALTVFNTATAGTAPNNVVPGYYYWNTNDSKWVRLLDKNDEADLRLVGNANHITQDAGFGGNGTDAGTGENNILIGENSGAEIGAANNNVGIGKNTLSFINDGYDNVAIGALALEYGRGIGNTIIGKDAGKQLDLYSDTNPISNYNTIIGAYAANTMVSNEVVSGSNNIFIGAGSGGVDFPIGVPSGVTNNGVLSNYLNIGNLIYGRDIKDVFTSTVPGSEGFIGIGTTYPIAKLEVNGALRGGTPHPDELNGTSAVGKNSIAYGSNNKVNGENSFAFGYQNEVSNDNSFTFGEGNAVSGTMGIAFGSYNTVTDYATAFGSSNQVSGMYGTAFGGSNIVTGTVATAFGLENTASGTASSAFGTGNIASENNTTVFGTYNAIRTNTPGTLLQVGNGAFNNSNNALTVMDTGFTGVGILGQELDAVPTEMLDIGSGSVRVREINNDNGDTATDKVVVADATGVLKTVPSSSFSNIYTANGALAGDRTVDLNTNSLTFQGNEGYLNIESGGNYMSLHADNPDRSHFRMSTQDVDNDGVISLFDMDLFSDNYMQINASGEMNRMIFGTNATQNSSSIEFVTSSGAFASGMPRMVITGEGNIGMDDFSPDERLVIGSGNVRIDDINDVANQGDVSTDRIVVANADGVLKTVAASAIAPNVTTNNGITQNTATNDIELGGDLNRATTIDQNGNELAIATGGENLIISGLDKTKVQATVNGATTTGITDHLLAVGADNTVKALKAAMPKFFFMPSIIIPTSEQQLDAPNSGKVTGDVFDDATLTGTINLYGRYQEQFSTTGTAVKPSNPGAPALPVLPASELNYYVTWYDPTVFTSVTINASGVMTYGVDANADVTTGSFMNIVFSVKED